MADSDDFSNEREKLIGQILKKALSVGMDAYAVGEEKLTKTLSAVQNPKEFLKEALENLFDNYSLRVEAELKLIPKRRSSHEDVAKTNLNNPGT